jgi:glutamate-1-semialdehyde 2,1-aminomutase
MDAAQETFISSTAWTERIGPVAALATLRKHRDQRFRTTYAIGTRIRRVGGGSDGDRSSTTSPNGAARAFWVRSAGCEEVKTLLHDAVDKGIFVTGRSTRCSRTLTSTSTAILTVNLKVSRPPDRHRSERRGSYCAAHSGFKRLT